jgi:hypothetical protein
MSDEGFFKRWARLKAQPEQDAVLAPVVDTTDLPAAAPAEGGSGAARLTRPGLTPDLDPSPPEQPPPTIADAAALTSDSDFSAFVGKNVDAAVRRLAMKKLFADPHFHGHDGLDIYMGDYTLPSPVSAGMLAEMTHNKNLFAKLDEVIDKVIADVDKATETPDTPALDQAQAPPLPEPPAPAPPPPDQEVA